MRSWGCEEGNRDVTTSSKAREAGREGGRRMTRTTRWPTAVLAVLAMLPWSLQARDPLAGQVSIYRDEYGVPHIVGETEEATFFGYGYAQAQDHLEKMFIQYRDAQGRRAEVQGFQALGDGYLRFIPYEYRWDGDYLQRLLRTKQTVVEHRAEIDPQVYRILSSFARGVNAYIAGAPRCGALLDRRHHCRRRGSAGAQPVLSLLQHS